jgi:putative FmdB family regulatory protein
MLPLLLRGKYKKGGKCLLSRKSKGNFLNGKSRRSIKSSKKNTEPRLFLLKRKANKMPLYDYFCEHCGYEGEHLTGVNDQPECPKCTIPMKRRMPSTHGINMGASGAYGYFDDNLGIGISTNKQRREEMKRQGVQENFGKGWY